MGSYIRKFGDSRFSKYLTLVLGALVIAALPLFASTQSFNVPDDAKNLIWRGSATDTLSDKSDKNIKKLNNAVHKLFERFPPQAKNQ